MAYLKIDKTSQNIMTRRKYISLYKINIDKSLSVLSCAKHFICIGSISSEYYRNHLIKSNYFFLV